MEIRFQNRALAELDALSVVERQRLLRRLEQLRASWGHPHLHAGLGLRKIGFDLYEIRMGLKIRVVFLRKPPDLVAVCIGNHDDVEKWKKQNT